MNTEQTGWLFLVAGLLVLMANLARESYPAESVHQRTTSLEDSVATLVDQREAAKQTLDRWREIIRFADRYEISNELSGRVVRAARAESIALPIAFRLVWRESRFEKRAVSSANAVGLTQIKPSTARTMKSSVTRGDLFDPDLNLRLGFRYLHRLIKRYEGDVYLALSGYHQGPTRLAHNLENNRNPSHSYATTILSKD